MSPGERISRAGRTFRPWIADKILDLVNDQLRNKTGVFRRSNTGAQQEDLSAKVIDDTRPRAATGGVGQLPK